MKTNTFFLTRWWNKQNLQARLLLVFTILLVFCVLTLSIFLFNIVAIIDLNNQARIIFEENRKVYQLETLLKQYDLGVKQYEVSASPTAGQKLPSFGERIDESAAALRMEIPEDDLATLDKFIAYKAELTPLVDQVIQAVDKEDWIKVQELDGQVEKLLGSLYGEIHLITSNGVDELNTIKDDAETFSLLALLGGILSLPAFLVLANIAMLIIYLQINLPVEQLARAANDLQAGKFQPAELEKLAKRTDEIGIMAREFITMAISVEQRTMKLQQEADEIRAKIR